MRVKRSASAPELPAPRSDLSPALRYAPRLKNPRLLESLPRDVRDYFEGREPHDLAHVLQWAIKHEEEGSLRHAVETGFEGPVRVFDLNPPVIRLAVELGMAIELRLHVRIDSSNAHELISLLEMSGAKVLALDLDLSSKLNDNALRQLCQAIDHLYGNGHLTQLNVSMDGLAGRPDPDCFPETLYSCLRASEACLVLSAFVRQLFVHDRGLVAKVEDQIEKRVDDARAKARKDRITSDECFSDAEALQRDADWLGGGGQRKDVERAVASHRLTGAKWLESAVQLEHDATAMCLAPRALALFLAGKPLSDEMVDALAYVALTFRELNLLRAVRILAPHYVVQLYAMPSRDVIALISSAKIPCSLPSFTMPRDGLRHLLHELTFDLVSLDLTVVDHLDLARLRELTVALSSLKVIQNVSFTISPGASLSLESFNSELRFASLLDSLTLEGAGHPDTNTLMGWLIGRMRPERLTLGSMTDIAAAELLRHIDATRIEDLVVYCKASSSERNGHRLLDAVQHLIKQASEARLTNITVRSDKPLEYSDTLLNNVIRNYPPKGTVRIEHFSPDNLRWEGYVHTNLLLRGVSEAFFVEHLKLPGDMGFVMSGMLSPHDISSLLAVSKTTHQAGGKLRLRQIALSIALHLQSVRYLSAEALRDALDEVSDPVELANEVRRRLVGHAPLMAVLDEAIGLKK